LSKKSIFFYTNLAFFILALLVYAIISCSALLCDVAFNPKSKIFVNLASKVESGNPDIQQIDWLKNESGYIDTQITSSTDSIPLHAFEIHNTTAYNWVIMVHGYRSSPWGVSDYAYNYYNMGYNVLLPALRGVLGTGGNWITFGYREHLDICDWVNYLVEKQPNCKIILHGVSMGASTVMMTAGEELPDNVRLVIEDSGYSSLSAELTHLAKISHTPASLIVKMMDTLTQKNAGFGFGDVNCIASLKRATLPIYFIHGEKDNFVPYQMLDELYTSYAHAKEKLSIANSTHIHGSTIAPREYWSNIARFISIYY